MKTIASDSNSYSSNSSDSKARKTSTKAIPGAKAKQKMETFSSSKTVPTPTSSSPSPRKHKSKTKNTKKSKNMKGASKVCSTEKLTCACEEFRAACGHCGMGWAQIAQKRLSIKMANNILGSDDSSHDAQPSSGERALLARCTAPAKKPSFLKMTVKTPTKVPPTDSTDGLVSSGQPKPLSPKVPSAVYHVPVRTDICIGLAIELPDYVGTEIDEMLEAIGIQIALEVDRKLAEETRQKSGRLAATVAKILCYDAYTTG